MNTSKVKILKSITFVALLLAFVVVALGAYTRLKDAGLGCPDWPGCYGHLTVPSQDKALEHSPDIAYHAGKAWKEMIHRYAAATLGIMVLGIFVYSLLIGQQSNVRWLSCSLLMVILFQALLGMYTVTLKLHPLIVTGHLLGGFTTLALLLWIWLRLGKNSSRSCLMNGWGQRRKILILGLILLGLQIFLGGWTSSNYAALACPDFPTCRAQWVVLVDWNGIFNIPLDSSINFEGGVLSADARAGIHWLHRVGAVVVTFYLIVALIPLLRQKRDIKLKRAAYYVLMVLLVQVLLGISNVVFNLPLPIAVAHNINAILLVSLLGRLVYCLTTDEYHT